MDHLESAPEGDMRNNNRRYYMEPTTGIPNWMEDPSVQDIPREKLAFLSQLYQQGQGKSQKEMMSFLMPMMAQAKQKGLTFTPKELQIAIAAIRKSSTPEELRQIDQIISKAKEKK
ncbi:MAG: hypothetical protein HFH80_14580 [Lachnospiraceae bacterium]|nr:hypothetical protein [Lachnospiraceae bacterium]